jgi:hypothetical protein
LLHAFVAEPASAVKQLKQGCGEGGTPSNLCCSRRYLFRTIDNLGVDESCGRTLAVGSRRGAFAFGKVATEHLGVRNVMRQNWGNSKEIGRAHV